MKVDEIVKNAVERHTFFQLNHFILGKEPTHQAKMKKCIDELKLRKNTIDSIMLEIDDLNDKNELIMSQTNESEILKRMSNRRVGNNKRQIEKLLTNIKNQQEELVFFEESFNKLNEIQPLRNWDDADVQLEYWNAKLTEEINYKLALRLPIDTETLRLVFTLPKETPIKKQVLGLFNNKSKIEEITSM